LVRPTDSSLTLRPAHLACYVFVEMNEQQSFSVVDTLASCLLLAYVLLSRF
jgi:hypothetical protein